MKLIDAHAHLTHDAKGIDEIVESGVFEQIWLMDLYSVGKLGDVRFAEQKELLDTVRRYDGFFLAFGFLDLDRDTPDQIDRLRDLGFAGLKPYQLHPYNHESYYPLYERAQSLGMPVLFHTGLIAKGTPYDPKHPHAFGPENMRPIHLAGIAEAFPDLWIIGGHQGYPYLEEMQHNLYYYKNILGVSGYLRSSNSLKEIWTGGRTTQRSVFFNEKLISQPTSSRSQVPMNARSDWRISGNVF